MIHVPVLCCLFLAVSAGSATNQRTTLEDIERDYLTSQKMTKLTPPKAAPSPSQYGFVPSKTLTDYVQREPRPNYIQPQYVPAQSQQYQQQQDYTQYAPQKYTTSFKQYSTPQYVRAQQKYVPQSTAVAEPQQTYRYIVPQTQAQAQAQVQAQTHTQTQAQYQGYENNVQYVTDNSIGQAGPQYYTPQYVYLQQYSSPSTAVQTVVDPKGGLQYVMYVPAYVPPTAADQTQNYENIVYTPAATQESSPSAYQAPEAPQVEYTSQAPQKAPVQYVQPKSKYTKAEYVFRREPKSLLDSYVPSVLQLQYYNQARQNSIQEPVRVSQAVRGKNVKSGYRAAEPEDSESTLSYSRYQPGLYKS